MRSSENFDGHLVIKQLRGLLGLGRSTERRVDEDGGGIPVLAAVLLTVALVPAARAATPAAQDEYNPYQPYQPYQPYNPNTPGGTTNQQQVAAGTGSGGSGGQGQNANAEPPGAAGTEAQAGSGGTLPFTGYPMTTLVWVMLGLIAGGIVLRLGLATAKRLSVRSH